MYCSTCGVSVAQGLSYCNYCGAKLSGTNDNAPETPAVRPEFLIAAMVGTFILGMVAITLLMGMMKQVLGLPVEGVLVFTLLPFLVLLALEGVFLRLLFRGKRRVEDKQHTMQAKEQVTNELNAAHARALQEPLSSVTDNTTRSFAPLTNERKLK
jgi:predicted lipid-binding transport protein (Tim44 family)